MKGPVAVSSLDHPSTPSCLQCWFFIFLLSFLVRAHSVSFLVVLTLYQSSDRFVYVQSVTKALSLGGEIFWLGKQRKSGYGLALRHQEGKGVSPVHSCCSRCPGARQTCTTGPVHREQLLEILSLVVDSGATWLG
jgi:hypothetical protein